jgi:molybdenum cofactor guanylyltransferase
MTDACSFILAGGNSSRMGVDKAFLQFHGSTLLAHALAVARSAAAEVRVIGSHQKFDSFAQTIEDQFPGCGPLAGIHAALSSSTCDYNLILAVDMPFVNSTFLDYLFAQSRLTDATVTLPRDGARFQPLCAVYRRAFAPLAAAALRARKYRIDDLFSKLPLRVIDEVELLQQGFSLEIFRNLNTPEEFKQATLVKKS